MSLTQKLHKILATWGLGSRREIECWIQQKRIQVNGKIASIGMRIQSLDQIRLDEKVIPIPPELFSKETIKTQEVLLYYKPAGEICTRNDPQKRTTVFTKLPPIAPYRWVMVGRLDINTVGLLLFTTEGELAHRLLHPKYQIEREYAVRVHGNVTPEILSRLKQGIFLEGKQSKFLTIATQGSSTGRNQWYRVVLTEGRNREVRKLWASQGITVSRLIRIRFGPIHLPTQLKPGQSVRLAPSSIAQLIHCVQKS